MTRDEILAAACEIINGERAEVYGPVRDQQERTAKIWSVIFGVEVSAQKVVLAMIGNKIARLANPLRPDMDHPDSWIDISGYGGLGGELTSTGDLEVRAVEKRTPPF